MRTTYSANQLRACSSSSGGKNFTGTRRTLAPAKASARVSQRGSATMAILEILSACKKRKSRSFQIRAVFPAFKVLRSTSETGFPIGVDMSGECHLLCAKFGSFQRTADA